MTNGHSNIPDEFKQRDQWLLYDSSNDTPRQPHWKGNFGISWSDPDDWHSLEEAVEAGEQRDSWGIGYVMAAGNDDHIPGCYACIDIDGAYDENGELREWVPDLDLFFDSKTYTEHSASKQEGGLPNSGLHIPVPGDSIPEWWSDCEIHPDLHQGVDVLENKFCVFTGDKHPESGASVANIDPTPWLLEAYKNIEGEVPFEDSPEASAVDETVDYDGDEWLDKEAVEDALSYVDPDLPHDEWVKVLFAIHDWDSGSTGQSVGEQWSRQGSKWDGEAKGKINHVWSNAGVGKGVTRGTLVHKAKSNGWDYTEHTRSGRSNPGVDAGKPPEDAAETDGGAVASESTADPGSDSTSTWAEIQAAYTQGEQGAKSGRFKAAMKLLDEYHFATVDDTGEMLVYHEESGVFERGAERDVEQELQRGLGRHYSQHEKREVLGHIRARTYEDRDDFNAGQFDEPLICVGNGVVNVETMELYEHSPDYLFTRAVPWDYEPDAECPHLESFMDDITRREADKLTMYEMVGHALHPEYVTKHSMILFGPGDNGKSLFYRFVRELLGGRRNISAVPLQKISDNRFAAETIIGKFANVAPDMDAKRVSDLGDWKTLTGGDPYFVEPKGEQGYEAVNTATMMFGCNEPPVLPERGKKVETRLVPVELPYVFEENPDPDNALEKQAVPEHELVDPIETEEEMSAFLVKALEGLQRLLDNRDVSLPESPKERLEYYEKHSDPIKRFAVDCIETQEGNAIAKTDVYNAYTKFCNQNDLKVADKRIFWKKLRQTTFPVRTTKPHGEERLLVDAALTEFGEQFTTQIQSDSQGQATPDGDGTVDLLEAAKDATGYPTVEAEVKHVELPDGENTPALKATLVDGNAAIDVVDWDDSDSFDVGQRVRIENADTTTYDGATQLVIKDGVTQVHVLEETRDDSADTSIEEHSTDGTDDVEQLKPNVEHWIREQDDGSGVDVSDVYDHFIDEQGIPADDLDAALDHLRKDGRIHEPEEGVFVA